MLYHQGWSTIEWYDLLLSRIGFLRLENMTQRCIWEVLSESWYRMCVWLCSTCRPIGNEIDAHISLSKPSRISIQGPISAFASFQEFQIWTRLWSGHFTRLMEGISMCSIKDAWVVSCIGIHHRQNNFWSLNKPPLLGATSRTLDPEKDPRHLKTL